jgi:ribosomal protein L23
MLLIPRVSEKAYGATLRNVYVFDVQKTAVKAEVKKAVEAEFKDVKVKDVRLVVVKGKPKTSVQGKRSRRTVTRADFKKAYVTLAEGKIEINAFKAEEPAETTAAKNEPKVVAKEAEAVEAKKVGLFAKRRTGRRGNK